MILIIALLSIIFIYVIVNSEKSSICEHQFTIIQKNKIHDSNGNYVKDEYISRCTKCGRLKKDEF